MEKMWLKEGVDLKMVTFGCVPTGDRQGMVELVTEAKTLREIQVMGKRGVTGSFKDTPISDYLVKHNPSQLEFARAVNNFTRSCAGYSVITYILGNFPTVVFTCLRPATTYICSNTVLNPLKK